MLSTRTKLPILLGYLAGCAAVRLTLSPQERNLIGCYELVLQHQDWGAALGSVVDTTFHSLVLRLDTVPRGLPYRSATFLDPVPLDQDFWLVSWTFARDTIYVRTRPGKEGQGLRLALNTAADSVVGQADWGWSTIPWPMNHAPVRGARRACP